jgi:protease-4
MLPRRSWVLALSALSVLAGPGPARAADEEKQPLVAHIRLHGDLDEGAVNPDPLFGGGLENFKSKIDRIRKAAKDPDVKALYLQFDGAGIGFGKVDELCGAIADFRKTGKKAFAYVESGLPRDYLVAVACDEICVPETGWLLLVGLRAEVNFYKDLFDLLGVKADMLQMGDFKSAAEPFSRSSLSEPARRQLKLILDDHFEHGIVGRIVKGRAGKKWSDAHVEKLIDQGPFTARTALKLGLIDRVAYADAFEETFKTALGVEKIEVKKNYAQAKADQIDLGSITGILKLLAPAKLRESGGPKVAVIYATGAIVTGKSGFSLLGGETCGSTTIIEALRQAEENATVKAIVLRVDSPGGSALASDLIYHELQRCKKPVVASMSDVAASGGYYISVGAQRIFANPGTLTGSIGVVGGKLAIGGALDRIGIKTDVLSRGANAGILSSNQPFSPSERAAMTAMMRDIYDQFLDKVVDGRQRAGMKMDRAHLEKEVAGGRVWTGRQAKLHFLIDELGGLDDAVAAAWKMAGQPAEKTPEILQLPKSKGVLDSLLERSGESHLATPELARLLGQVPEARRLLAPAEALLQLRGEPVWLLLPYRLELN